MRAYAYQDGKATEGDIPNEVQSRAEELREQLVESIAETDEELMEKYFSEGELTTEDLVAGLRQAMLRREIFPVFFWGCLQQCRH